MERSGPAYAAAGIFAAGAATDGLDGYIARRSASKSRTGQWLDPLADKALVSAPIVTLTLLGRFPAWAAVVIVAREAGISILRAYLGVKGIGMPASQGAKVKTTLQLIAVTLYILPLSSWADGLKLAFLAVAVLLTIYTGARYVAGAGTRLAEASAADSTVSNTG